MKCERCAGYAETAEDVRKCLQCVQDGTAAQITTAIADNTVLASLCLPDTGLANRFKPGSLAIEEPLEQPPEPKEQAKPTEPAKPAAPRGRPRTRK